MYSKDFYRGKTENEIAELARKEGFNPIKFSNSPGFVYTLHQHPETKLLAFLKGSMEVKVNGETFLCELGDKLIIPGNTPHAAVVGNDGCEFFWSEKLL